MKAEVPIADDGQLESECTQALERLNNTRKNLEPDRIDVRRCEFLGVERGTDRLQENARAVTTQLGEARLVVALTHTPRVMLGLRLEPCEHDLRSAFGTALGECAEERGHRIDEGRKRSVRVERDRVELRSVHATHCHSA